MSAAEDQRRLRREIAADWCTRLAAGLPSLEDQADFEAWLASDTANRAAFEQTAAMWHGAAAIAHIPEVVAVRADALEAFRAANGKRWSSRVVTRWRALEAVAACLLLVMIASYVIQGRPEIYVTAVGERRLVKLEDGSRISLDADTKVEVAYSNDRRRVRLLGGRAKFDVAQDPRRPFTVAAGDRLIVATGTAFSVELLQKQMRVVLYQGHVAVLEDGASDQPPRHVHLRAERVAADQALNPGTEMVASLDRPVASVGPVDAVRSLSWEGGQLTFNDEPLGLAAEQVNRYSDLKINVVGSAARIPISGAFNAGDTEGFIDGVRALYPLAASRVGDTITLTKSSSP